MDLLQALQSAGGSDSDIFASLGGGPTDGVVASGSQPQVTDTQKASASAPSPGSILAGFAAATGQDGGASGSIDSSQLNFDLSMPSFGEGFFDVGDASHQPDVDMMDMSDIFDMSGGPSTNPTAPEGSGSAPS